MGSDDTPSQNPYSEKLAEAVAELLQAGQAIIHSHRDYCGMGLEYLGGKFRYGTVYDGGMEKAEFEFSTALEFVKWLGSQSDLSLHGQGPWSGNQRIDRARLIEALQYAGRTFVD